ncbi:DUF1036 domain-containing protein [Paenibacillus lacisoli]|nr:DUF1036 domain-containing protein [Paenibacillus sp. JX-17]
MSLYFRNSTRSTVYVAYAYPDFSCSPVNYAKIGWYRISPGQTREVWSGYAGGTTFFFYAENSSRSLVWEGSYFTQVPQQAFQWCWDTRCTNCRTVGFRRLYVPSQYGNYTVNLVTANSGVRSTKGSMKAVLPLKVKKSAVRRTPLKPKSKVIKGKPKMTGRIGLK